jgi:hypothetical protein
MEAALTAAYKVFDIAPGDRRRIIVQQVSYV